MTRPGARGASRPADRPLPAGGSAHRPLPDGGSAHRPAPLPATVSDCAVRTPIRAAAPDTAFRPQLRAAVSDTASRAALPARSSSAGRLVRWLTVPMVMMVAAACSAEPEPTPAPAAAEEPSPFADCAALTAPPSAALTPSAAPASPPSSRAPGAAVADLPDLEVPCFTGEQPFRLTELRGPAVINLWASWCEPCREELPAMQRLADRTAGRLTVLTVNTGDRRDAAASFAAAKDVSLPTLYDRERKLASALGRITLPVTVFVDASGRTHVDPMPFDDARLAASVVERTGVTVTR